LFSTTSGSNSAPVKRQSPENSNFSKYFRPATGAGTSDEDWNYHASWYLCQDLTSLSENQTLIYLPASSAVGEHSQIILS